MLASQYLPLNSNSARLSVSFLYGGLERVLVLAGNDWEQVRPAHYVDTLLRLAVTALEHQVERDSALVAALQASALAHLRFAYRARFAPWLSTETEGGKPGLLEEIDSVEKLKQFGQLVATLGLGPIVVLVDGVDEFPESAKNPQQLALLLAPLLGTLALIECPGWAFRFFLSEEIEETLHNCSWFRPDRLGLFRITWNSDRIQQLLAARLSHFSKDAGRVYTQISQLCQDELAEKIDRKLVELAGNRPRAALALADLLLQAHCDRPNPPDRIRAETWMVTEQRWATLQGDLLGEWVLSSERMPVSEERGFLPLLVVKEEVGRVWLGNQEISIKQAQDYRVLAALYRNRNNVCSHDWIAEQAWPEAHGGVSDEMIAAAIRRLRVKLGQETPFSGYIETIKGRGYRLYPGGFSS
ncbi:MAG: winged helix-turn-helix domain-containing protein [Anaerolineae bacterium]